MMLISKLPDDKKIGVNLFSTGDWFDRRQAAQARVESYRTVSSKYQGYLWGTQYAGSRAITLFQNVSSSQIPSIGDVFMISNTLVAGQTEYVRVTKITTNEIQNFSVDTSTFQRRVITAQISNPLTRDYVGVEMQRTDSITANAQLFNTVVTNAAKYYSARPLKNDAAIGDLVVSVDSVYSQLIPSSQASVALTDLNAGGYTMPLAQSGNPITFTTTAAITANSALHLGNPCKAGSLSITAGTATLTDSGGQIKSGATAIGTIDYNSGILSFASTSPTFTGSKTVTYTPAAAPVRISDTATLAVTAANRSYVWAITLTPTPAAGSLTVSYRAMGKWYSLRDNSIGGLIGIETGTGTGTINYSTGTATLTTAALPDADSEIIFSWGGLSSVFNRSNVPPLPFGISHALTNKNIYPTTLTISWNLNNVPKSATCDALGNIQGDARGRLLAELGILYFYPLLAINKGTTFAFDYQYNSNPAATNQVMTETFTGVGQDGSGNATITLAHGSVIPSSIVMQWDTETPSYATDSGVTSTVGITTTPYKPDLNAVDEQIRLDDANLNRNITQGQADASALRDAMVTMRRM